jgi:DNA helicase-2/ATP-dependent DNA helicase PcrA
LEPEIQSAYQEELQRLEQTAAEIDRQIRVLADIPRYYGDDLTEQALENARETRRRNLAIAENEPYFGRLDFQEHGQSEPSPLYIGKVGIEDEKTGQPIVIDWRAPVASLFYSFTGGEGPVSYESPDGLIEGLVYLKRNLVIRKKILQRVVDTYVRGGDNLSVADEFLLYRLEENKDNRLRDIVSTIQEEQDRIIRAPKNTALVIQGVAGSGKTTVALHRLAYLLYQYRENIRAERMIIFAPNAMFLDYISSVLPELGVGGIQQTTFSRFVLDLLGHEVELADPSERLQHWFQIGPNRPVADDSAPGRFKGSIRFLTYLDGCLDRWEQHSLPEADFEPWEGAKLPAATIREWFHTEYRHYPLMKRRERVIARIKRWVEIELDNAWETHLKKEYKKTASARLRAYQKAWPELTPFAFYKLLFSKTKRPAWLPKELLDEIPSPIVEDSNRLFKKRQVELEDLAPLLHIHHRFYGIDGHDIFDHVVIDEAQDFSPFQIAVLNARTRGGSFTILGDLSQGIHAYQGIRDWQEFLDLFPGEGASGFFRLDRSYRSTMEIIQFANEVIARSGEPVTLARPVFRSGEPVRVEQIPATQRLDAILRTVRELTSGTANTVAVVGRTDAECAEIHKHLTEHGLSATLIHSKQTDYQGGLSVLPVYLTKGLEFDAVLLTDVDADHYGLNAADAKLLYVGCTRDLHQLRLHYSGEISPLIAGIDTTA